LLLLLVPGRRLRRRGDGSKRIKNIVVGSGPGRLRLRLLPGGRLLEAGEWVKQAGIVGGIRRRTRLLRGWAQHAEEVAASALGPGRRLASECIKEVACVLGSLRWRRLGPGLWLLLRSGLGLGGRTTRKWIELVAAILRGRNGCSTLKRIEEVASVL
jgi:hypothetical protein